MAADLFVATPLHDGRVFHHYLFGVLGLVTGYPLGVRVEVQVGPHLPFNRDLLTSQFLASKCSKLLWVDSDIGFRNEHFQALLDARKDFVGGCYATKDAARRIPTELLGIQEGELQQADYVPSGFLLLSRDCVQRMTDAHAHRRYRSASGRETCALWYQEFAMGDDTSFCARWRALGGEIWLHSGVVVDHIGNHVYQPSASALEVLRGGT
jgi:hypothetical protein